MVGGRGIEPLTPSMSRTFAISYLLGCSIACIGAFRLSPDFPQTYDATGDRQVRGLDRFLRDVGVNVACSRARVFPAAGAGERVIIHLVDANHPTCISVAEQMEAAVARRERETSILHCPR
jgi:hypothetical protein